MAWPHIVLTGFRAFPGVANNPSALVVEAFARAQQTGTPQCHLLDTVYDKARDRIAALLDAAPDALILTGYSHEATGLVLETRATAACLPTRADAAGCLPPEPGTSCDHENRAVDAQGLVEHLTTAGIPASLSRDAGGYLCNHVFWQALDLIAERSLPTRALFVHLPRVTGMEDAPEGAGEMPLADMLRGLAIIAEGLSQPAPP